MYTTKKICGFDKTVIYIREINNYNAIDCSSDFTQQNNMEKDELIASLMKIDEKEASRIRYLIEKKEEMDYNYKENKSYPLFTLCLHPVRTCNFKCKYCFAIENETLPEKNISLETAKKAIEYMVFEWGRDGKRYVVDLAGSGEPLLHFEFIKKIEEHCEELRSAYGKDIKIMFPTNGALLTDEMCKYFENKPNILLGFSIDGNEIQDKNRIYPNGCETYKDALRGIKMIKNRRFGLAVTITSQNESVDEVYDFLYSEFENADAISMNIVRDYEEDSLTSVYRIDMDNLVKHYEKLLDNVFKKIKEGRYDYIRKLLVGTDTMGIYINRILTKGMLTRRRCGAGTCIAAVDHEENLYACSVSNGNKRFWIGDLKAGIDSKKTEKYRGCSVEGNDRCKVCWASYICSGECYITAFLTGADIRIPNEYLCRFRKKLIELCIAFVVRLQTDNQYGYLKIMEMVKHRIFFESNIDSAPWVVQKYINAMKYDCGYSHMLMNLKSGHTGVEPQHLEIFIKNYNKDFQSFRLEDKALLKSMNYPMISFLNKSKTMFYEYVFVKSIEDDEFIIQRLAQEDDIRVPVELFLNCMSDVFMTQV